MILVTKQVKVLLPCSTSSLLQAPTSKPINQGCHRCFVRISNVFGHQQNINSITLQRSIFLTRKNTSKDIMLVSRFATQYRSGFITPPSLRNGSSKSTFSSSSSSSSSSTTKRKLRNRKLGEKKNSPPQQQQQATKVGNVSQSSQPSSPWNHSFLSKFGLVTGDTISNKYSVFTSRDRTIGMLYRVPLWVVICILMVSDETSPISILQGSGPSMLPTMATSDEIWLMHNLSIYRNLGLKPPTLSVNDIVLWKQPEEEEDERDGDGQPQQQQERVEGRRRRPLACKRIVGVEGDVVKRYGQYCHIYTKHRDDGGIRWPANTKDIRHFNEDRHHPSEQDVSLQRHTEDDKWGRTVVVPKNHVWLEGDCPLLSIDSRHVGPIPNEWIRGKVVARLWPLGGQTQKVDRNQRPIPYPHIEDYLGDKYNLYRIQSSQKQQQQRDE